MRLVWVSFDVMGRDCLAAAAEAGADVVGVVTLPGPIDPNRSGQCSFDEIAAELGARADRDRGRQRAGHDRGVREADPDLIFVVGWSQLVRGRVHRPPAARRLRDAPDAAAPPPRARGDPMGDPERAREDRRDAVPDRDPTADSGPVVGQVEVPIAPTRRRRRSTNRLTAAHLELVRQYVPSFRRDR